MRIVIQPMLWYYQECAYDEEADCYLRIPKTLWDELFPAMAYDPELNWYKVENSAVELEMEQDELLALISRAGEYKELET